VGPEAAMPGTIFETVAPPKSQGFFMVGGQVIGSCVRHQDFLITAVHVLQAALAAPECHLVVGEQQMACAGMADWEVKGYTLGKLDVIALRPPPSLFSALCMKSARFGQTRGGPGSIFGGVPGRWQAAHAAIPRDYVEGCFTHLISTRPGFSGAPIYDSRGVAVGVHLGACQREGKVVNYFADALDVLGVLGLLDSKESSVPEEDRRWEELMEYDENFNSSYIVVRSDRDKGPREVQSGRKELRYGPPQVSQDWGEVVWKKAGDTISRPGQLPPDPIKSIKDVVPKGVAWADFEPEGNFRSSRKAPRPESRAPSPDVQALSSPPSTVVPLELPVKVVVQTGTSSEVSGAPSVVGTGTPVRVTKQKKPKPKKPSLKPSEDASRNSATPAAMPPPSGEVSRSIRQLVNKPEFLQGLQKLVESLNEPPKP